MIVFSDQGEVIEVVEDDDPEDDNLTHIYCEYVPGPPKALCGTDLEDANEVEDCPADSQYCVVCIDLANQPCWCGRGVHN